MNDLDEMSVAAILVLIHSKALEYGVNPELLQAIVKVESDYNPWVSRYEPMFKYVLTPRTYADNLQVTYDTELNMQKSSIGLAQVMGGLARDLGHQDHLSKLYIPSINLSYACKYIKRLYVRYGEENEEAVIAAYNAGQAVKTESGMWTNQPYVDKVFSELRELRK